MIKSCKFEWCKQKLTKWMILFSAVLVVGCNTLPPSEELAGGEVGSTIGFAFGRLLVSSLLGL